MVLNAGGRDPIRPPASIIAAGGSHLGNRRKKTDRTWEKHSNLVGEQNTMQFAVATRAEALHRGNKPA